MAKPMSFLKKYAESLVALIIALVVIFFVLNFLHSRFSNNAVGSFADKVGSMASGQAYNFSR